jgi:hypothetical protein
VLDFLEEQGYCPIFMLGQSSFFLAVGHCGGVGSRGRDKVVLEMFQTGAPISMGDSWWWQSMREVDGGASSKCRKGEMVGAGSLSLLSCDWLCSSSSRDLVLVVGQLGFIPTIA